MERSSILRWVIIAVAVLLIWQFWPKLFGGGGNKSALQPLPPESACSAHGLCLPDNLPPERTCDIQGVRFKAQLGSRGATLKHLWLQDERYHHDGKPIDLVTTPDVLERRPLRFDFRTGMALDKAQEAQLAYDMVDWQLVSQDPKSCVFEYRDDRVQMQRTIRATDRPFELDVQTTLKNVSPDKRKHQLGVEAASWRTNKETESHLGRQSPFITHVTCANADDTTRLSPSDFEPSDFADEGYESGWFVNRAPVSFAAVSDFYFAQALVPIEPKAQACKLQVEERWDVARHPKKDDDPNAGAMYRARVTYPPRELAPEEAASYHLLAYVGPKERDVLANAAGAHDLGELVDLGYFSIIAKVLLQFLVWLYGFVGNWGIAIILMTICVRTLLFPLTWTSIKSGLAMRRLKPQIDELNRKYKDDPQQKQIATMELWKKNKVNPLGGCLPALFQLPVWWALYTSLQTAVELYHTPFLWFRDLSAPDPYYILPIVLGGTMILQQRLMPMQLDPLQQKMMTYIMPAVFTVMMLFLPSGLAVYMLTNAVLGILQQLAIEKYWSGTGGGAVPASSAAK